MPETQAGGRRAPRAIVGCVAVAAACASATTAMARQAPLLEFGLGLGAIAFEDYRGSATTHAYPLPIPYLRYNGKFLKADREGVRGTLFDHDWVEVNLSGNATTPVRNDRARSGMPGLKSTLEVGPSVDFHLLHSTDSRIKVDVRVPLRAAITAAAPPKFVGFTFTPRLALDVADPFGYADWNLGVLLGPLFANRRYHEYFYSVAPQFARLARPAFRADGGYAGMQSIVALSKRFPRYWVGAFVRADTLAGASFADSPLVQRHGYWSAGLGFAWMLHTSRQLVEIAD